MAATTSHAAPSAIDHLELASRDDQTTLVVNLSDARQYRMFTLSGPDRIVVDIMGARLTRHALPLPAGAGAVRQVRAANRPDGSVRLVMDVTARTEPQGVMRRASGSTGTRLEVALRIKPLAEPPAGVATAAAAVTTQAPAPEPRSQPVAVPPVSAAAEPPTAPEAAVPGAGVSEPPTGRDVIVAVDAGHGGKDPGAHGPRGVLEKDVTLRLANRLAEVVNAEPGMRAVLTRSRDEFIPLRERMERARAASADLFVSIHADAVRNRSVQGASVYVLNEKGATDEAARRLAARENAADLIGGVSLKSRDLTLASVLLDLSQNAALSSSIDVADEILEEMTRVGTVRKRQVMQAPFMVLKSPDVPSVLVETAYISNPEEERRLDSNQYQGVLAAAIFAGVRDYFYKNPPRGTLVAEISRRRLAEARPYVVRPGDTLSTLATRYKVSVREIRDANQLKGDQVAVGQVIRIPGTQET